MYLLSTKPAHSDRLKRSSHNEGREFLQNLRQRVGIDSFDSFMAVQGDVSLMFVIDDTGSMSEEIQATKDIAYKDEGLSTSVSSYQLKNMIKLRFRSLGVLTVSRIPYSSSEVFLASFFLTSCITCFRCFGSTVT